MKKITLIILGAFLLVFSFVAFASEIASFQQRLFDSDVKSVKKMADCIDETYLDTENVMGKCSYDIANDCENKSVEEKIICKPTKKSIEYDCVKDQVQVEKTRQICQPAKGYLINDNILMKTKDYTCTPTEIAEGIIDVVCDSKFDGNGDGICTSGESCMEFIVQGNEITTREKNSKDEFVEQDKTFFVDKAQAEVLQ